jgi:DNA-binding NarL/FixJ family response regulator
MSDRAEDARIGVLLVDDHQMFVESLARLLADEDDIEVLGIVTDSSQAAATALRLRPEVVLVDYQMPGRDGVSITAEIKAAQPEVMVVMLTGSADDQVLLASIEAGGSGFLTKDRAADEVALAVRAAAAGEALISPAMLARLLPRLKSGFRGIGSDLTQRELDILSLMTKGDSNAAIAAQLHLSVNTIRNYVQSILIKLGAHSKLEALSIAFREKIVTVPISD